MGIGDSSDQEQGHKVKKVAPVDREMSVGTVASKKGGMNELVSE